MEHLTDEALAERVRQGFLDDYRVLVERHKNDVYALILCKVGEKEAAEDLAQEVFVKVHRFLPGFRGDSEFATWLYRLTLNTVSDYMRSKRRRPATMVLETVRGWFGSHWNEPEEEAIRKEERETVARLLESLPGKYRDILYLYHYRQLSYAEISDLLGLPLKTIETRLYRGKKLLKKQWLEVDGNDYASSERPSAGAISKP